MPLHSGLTDKIDRIKFLCFIAASIIVVLSVVLSCQCQCPCPRQRPPIIIIIRMAKTRPTIIVTVVVDLGGGEGVVTQCARGEGVPVSHMQ